MSSRVVPAAPDFGAEFEVMRPLGQGSMASVYLAREVALQRLVAIKVMDADLATDSVARQRFEREARAAARLSHPNIVAVYRVAALDGGRPYLVMEYVEGRNLEDAIAAQTIDAEAALIILTQLAQALSTAHEHNVVHRDVRPANVVWEPEGRRAVLMDFGIAAVLETGSEAVTRLTQAGEVLGDPRYSSPEQLLGEPLTGRADVYALAVVGYALLGRGAPFEASSKTAMIQAHMRATPKPLSSMVANVPRELDGLFASCLAKEPERRPDAHDVVRRLEAVKDRLDGASTASGSTYTGSPPGWMADHFPALHAFFSELKQRRVFNVAAVYAASTFAVLQVGQLILPELPLPEWTYTAMVAVTLAGFPVAMVLSWVFDLTDGAIRRTESTATASTRTKLLRGVGVAMSLGVAFIIGWWILRG